MLTIGKPFIEKRGGVSRLVCDVFVDEEKRTIWFEVAEEYEQYLCTERCDAYVIALLHWCMANGHDIASEVPITDELCYNLQTLLIPNLADHSQNMRRIRIDAPLQPPIEEGFAVGTGCSCGVDSFYTILKHLNSPYRRLDLTHVCVSSLGSFDIPGYRIYSSKEEVESAILAKAEEVARQLNLKLIYQRSNFALVFEQGYEQVLTFTICFGVYAMQKLWRIYYDSSNGYDLRKFSVQNVNLRSSSSTYYDLLSLPCFSTHALSILPDGLETDRMGKTRAIIDEPIVQKHLHVCWRTTGNCGQCDKCRRTILMLDACGKLDAFRESFDVDGYRAHITDYYEWLYMQMAAHKGEPGFMNSVYEIMLKRPEFAEFVRAKDAQGKRNRVKRIVKHPLRTAKRACKKVFR